MRTHSKINLRSNAALKSKWRSLNIVHLTSAKFISFSSIRKQLKAVLHYSHGTRIVTARHYNQSTWILGRQSLYGHMHTLDKTQPCLECHIHAKSTRFLHLLAIIRLRLRDCLGDGGRRSIYASASKLFTLIGVCGGLWGSLRGQFFCLRTTLPGPRMRVWVSYAYSLTTP